MKRCAGCGHPWQIPTEECINCGRDADMNRVEWKSEWGKPKNNY